MKIFILLLLYLHCYNSWAKKIALISSGGVSLGSYEAGILQEFLTSQQGKLPQDLKVVLGASAGGMNGLLTIFEACRTVPAVDKEGLLWKMWIPVGLDQLEDDDPNNKSLFHRRAVKNLLSELKIIWQQGFKESCNVVFGVTVTRKEPFIENIRPGLSITRQPEIFLVRIKGRGKGREPLIKNYEDQEPFSYRITLPLTEHNEGNLEKIFDIVLASASFPVAFTPYPISYCLFRPGEKLKNCEPSNRLHEDFIDGGIYQNSPVGRGFQILKKDYPKAKDLELIYINASAPLMNKTGIQENLLEKEWGVVSEIHGLVMNFLKTSRNMSLSENLQRFPDLAQFAKTNEKKFPLVSEPLYAFLGFIEEDFRVSDFYLGESDGHTMFNSSSIRKRESSCFSEHLLKEASNCKISKNLQILANLAKIRREKFPQKEGLGEIFKFLEKSKFHFKDLGLSRKQARFGKIALKNRFRKLAKSLVLKQPESLQANTRIILEQGLNQISFYPSARYAYALFGNSPEVGLSFAYKKEHNIPTSVRLNTSLMMIDYLNRLGSKSPGALTPLIGLRYQPESPGNSFWQFNLGLRAGYVLSSNDKLGAQSCDSEKVKTRVSECSGLVFQQVTALTLLERLRFQIVYQPDYGNNFGKFLTTNLYIQLGLVFPDIW